VSEENGELVRRIVEVQQRGSMHVEAERAVDNRVRLLGSAIFDRG
jgi:hypothetical protein